MHIFLLKTFIRMLILPICAWFGFPLGWLGTFGSKCARGPFRTIWHHKNTCNCEKKTLVEFFRRKVSLTDRIRDCRHGNYNLRRQTNETYRACLYGEKLSLVGGSPSIPSNPGCENFSYISL